MSSLRERAESHNATEPGADPGWAPAAAAQQQPQAEVNLDESPTEVGGDIKAHEAWSRVMADVQWIGKGRRTESGARYNYRGIDDILNVVGPALRRHGVVVMPVAAAPEWERVQVGGGSGGPKTMLYCRVTMTYAIIGPGGDLLPVQGVSVGESFDSGDKSTTKAMSVALRTFYVNALAIATNQPQNDPEHGPQYEIAAPKPPTADEYAEEIQNDRTTLNRLYQIRRELGDHRDIADTVVTLLDGTQTKLGDLLSKVGASRRAAAERQS